MKEDNFIRKILILIVMAAAGNDLFPQTESQLLPSDLKQQTVVTEPVTLRKGFLRTGFQVSYRIADRQFDGSGVKQYYASEFSGSSSALNMSARYGINDRLEISVVAEYQSKKLGETSSVISTETNSETTEEGILRGIGFGDTHLSARYQILREDRYRVSLTGNIDAILPTGEKNPTKIRSIKQYDLPVGDGSYAISGGLLARTITYPYSFTLFISYRSNFSGSKKFDPNDTDDFEFRFGDRLETGITTNLHLNEWIVFTNKIGLYHEAAGRVVGTDRITLPPSWALTYEPNLFFQVRRFRLAESVAIPVRGKNVPADPLFVMLVQYVF